MTYGNLKKLENASKDMSAEDRLMFEANVLGRMCALMAEKEFEEMLERAVVYWGRKVRV